MINTANYGSAPSYRIPFSGQHQGYGYVQNARDTVGPQPTAAVEPEVFGAWSLLG